MIMMIAAVQAVPWLNHGAWPLPMQVQVVIAQISFWPPTISTAILLLALVLLVLCLLWNRRLRGDLERRESQMQEQLAQLRDVDERLVYRAAFENVIAHISREFVTRSTSEVDTLFDESLRQVGRFLSVDRGYVFMFSDHHERVSNTHEWCAAGIKPVIDQNQQLDVESLPGLLNDTLRGQTLIINDIDDIPASQQNVHELLESQDIQSLITVPILLEGQVAGFIGFDSVNKKCRWSDENVRLLTVLAELFSGAIHRRAAQRKVRETRRRLELILDASPFPLALTRLSDDRLLFANDRLVEMLGLNKSDYVGTPASRFYALPKDRQRMLEQVNIWGRCDDFETRIRPLEGDVFWAKLSATTIDYDGARCLLATINDVTDARLASEQMQQAREEAEAASRSKSEFLSNMSHEIRTPMTSVLGFAELLSERDISDEDRLTYAGLIRRHGEHLLTIINDILDLSKIEAGRMDVERRRCDLSHLLADMRSMLEHRAVENGLYLKFKLSPPVPKYIESDSVRLRQILMNLVGNAIKFTEQGGITLSVELADSNSATSAMIIRVADTGIGINGEQQKRLFQPFNQADTSTSRRFGGTGLGLAISQRLAGILGGEIQVESTLGQGSTFTLTIDPGPIDLSQTISPDVLKSSVDELETGRAKSPKPQLRGRVLLAEDGPDNQRLIMHLLKHAGLDADLVGDGQAAVNKVHEAVAENNPYDIVLMDIQMPVMDGYAATQSLRGEGYDGVIIALTAHAMEDERDRCLAMGCNAHLSKPIMRAHFLKTLDEYLNGQGQS